ncbi:MAG: LamG domain-containing protein [Candidatus Marinimicrobia bacterium]|nr:LamG domain-containing protein [Candidatus Neomarinimicrobiota bacterium]
MGKGPRSRKRRSRSRRTGGHHPGNYNSEQNAGWEVHNDGQIRMWWNGEPDVYGSKDLRDNSWHHVAFVRDETNNYLRGYVDGVLEFENPGCGPDLSFTATHRIGRDNRSSGSPHFHGGIDELRVWSTARTQSQIREFMCEDVSSESGLVAYYRMTESSGTSLSDNAGTNTGTLNNMDNSDWVRDNQMPEGNGSTIPYRINGLNQLHWVSANSSSWSSDVEQITDIDAAATAAWDGGAGFSPAGTNANNFLGAYDGGGYTITGLTVNRPSENYTGFIGQLDGGPVSDLGMIDVSITGAHSTGGLVGYVESGNVSNCYVTGSVSGTDFVGGLVGQTANGTISQSYSTASVAGRGDHAGGLNGSLGSSIQNCYARGSVDGSANVGGLVGSALGGSTIDDSYSTGAVAGSSNVGDW